MTWSFSFRYAVPNALTFASAGAGFAAITFAHDRQYALAAGLILAAAVLDVADGFTARILSAATKIGAQLDSFADFLSFGVAPAVLAYHAGLDRLKSPGWAIAALYVFCTAYRLARFNVRRSDLLANSSFEGVPSTFAAAVVAAYVLTWLFFTRDTSPIVCAAVMVAACAAMVSRVAIPGPAIVAGWVARKTRYRTG